MKDDGMPAEYAVTGQEGEGRQGFFISLRRGMTMRARTWTAAAVGVLAAAAWTGSAGAANPTAAARDGGATTQTLGLSGDAGTFTLGSVGDAETQLVARVGHGGFHRGGFNHGGFN